MPLIEFLIQLGWISAALIALMPVFLIVCRISDKMMQPLPLFFSC